MLFKVLFAIAIGGGIGALSRYGISCLLIDQGIFPFNTLIVNLIGSFSLPFILYHKLIVKMSPTLRLALGTGVIGSFTTFSTFSLETITLIQNGAITSAIIYIFISVFGGLTLVWLGYEINDKKKG